MRARAAYAVQFASNAGFHVVAVVGSKDVQYVRTLGATDEMDYRVSDFADVARSVDVLIDTVGGDTRDRAFGVLKPGAILVTVVSTAFVPARSHVRSAFSMPKLRRHGSERFPGCSTGAR